MLSRIVQIQLQAVMRLPFVVLKRVTSTGGVMFWRKSRENADLTKFGNGLHRAHYQQKNSTNASRLTMILVKS